ncbi:hypothetical protein L1887_43405 [Cichorium endivia]|nr:hypothetical protein L1887_43405 [Cichorium endivia]
MRRRAADLQRRKCPTRRTERVVSGREDYSLQAAKRPSGQAAMSPRGCGRATQFSGDPLEEIVSALLGHKWGSEISDACSSRRHSYRGCDCDDSKVRLAR